MTCEFTSIGFIEMHSLKRFDPIVLFNKLLGEACISMTTLVSDKVHIFKVLSLLEAYIDLILDSSLHMKIQIMGGKITENLRFKSPLRKVKIGLSFFLFIFKFSIKNCISLFLTIFEYLVLQIRYQ